MKEHNHFLKIAKSLFRILVRRPIRVVKYTIKAFFQESEKWIDDFRGFFGNISIFFQETKNNNFTYEKIDQNDLLYLGKVDCSSSPLISFVSPMRYKDNVEHDPSLFFDSLIKNTNDLDKVEVIIAIDSDDYLKKFIELKQKYINKIKNLRILVCPEKFGYKKLHLYDQYLYRFLSPTSKMVADFSDDCKIIIKNWDNYVLDIDSKIKDNIYFIHTNDIKREKYVGPLKGRLEKLIWCEQVLAPASYFPIVSRRVIDIATKCLDSLSDLEKKEWAPLSNSTFYDCYVDIISHMISEGRVQRVFYKNLVEISRQYHSPKRVSEVVFDKAINLSHGKRGFSANDIGFITLLREETQIHIKLIFDKISNEIKISENPL